MNLFKIFKRRVSIPTEQDFVSEAPKPSARYAWPRVQIASGGPLSPYLINQFTGDYEAYLGKPFEPVDEGRFGSRPDCERYGEERELHKRLDLSLGVTAEQMDYAGRTIISGRRLRLRAWKLLFTGERFPQVGLRSVAQGLTGNDYGMINVLYTDTDGGLHPSHIQVKEHPYMVVDGDMIRLVGNGQEFIVPKQEWGSIEDILQKNPHLEVRKGKSSLIPEYRMPKSLREVLEQTRELTVKEIEIQSTPNYLGESNHSKRRVMFQYRSN